MRDNVSLEVIVSSQSVKIQSFRREEVIVRVTLDKFRISIAWLCEEDRRAVWSGWVRVEIQLIARFIGPIKSQGIINN
jgi:hypothetical protein